MKVRVIEQSVLNGILCQPGAIVEINDDMDLAANLERVPDGSPVTTLNATQTGLADDGRPLDEPRG